jgi:chorismate mutase / prephenate dehydrogenase
MENQHHLNESRLQIDEIDRQILDLLEQRNQVVNKVIETKIKNKLPVYVAKREAEKIQSFREMAGERGLDAGFAEDFLRMIMSSSRDNQSSNEFPRATDETKTVLIVGGAGEMGRLYARIAKASGYQVRTLDKNDWENVKELCSDVDWVIISVPIYLTRGVIEQISSYLPEKAVLSDFTSTKNGLLDLMLSLHKGPVLSLHPMHGPDVPNLSKQLMLISKGRADEQTDWICKQCELWGMRVKIVDPEKHDHAMHMIQGLRHFVALLHGSFMKAYDLKPEDILDFSSPIYRAELMMTGRIFAQDARLYADIVFSDDERRKLLKHFFNHHFLLSQLVETGDKDGFITEFNSIREFFGDFAAQALEESGYLIHRLADRFAQ